MRADRVHHNAKHKRKARRAERGAALVMVLLAIVVLTVFLTDVQQQSASTLSSAISARERLKAEYHARSAVNLSRLLLAIEPTVRRAITPMYALMQKGKKPPQIPVWEFTDGILGAYNCPEKAEAFSQLAGVDISGAENLGLGTGNGCFDVVIIDEDSKISVNAAARGDVFSRRRVASQLIGLMANPAYNVLFEEPDPDGQVSDRRAICSALIDWVDSDEDLEACDPFSDQASASGTEDNFYQTIGLNYFRKNAAFDSLEEMRLVRGMSDAFWATFVDPDPSNPRKRVLTVWGSGKVNINTANAQTLWSLACAGATPETPLCADMQQAQSFISTVTMAKAFTMGAPVFTGPNAFIQMMEGKGPIGSHLADMGVTPVVFKSKNEMKSILGTKSKMFSIYAEGVIPSYKRETRVSIHAVVDFRSATDITNMDASEFAELLSGNQPGGASPQASSRSSSTEDAAAAAVAALAQNPAGNLVYWRVQ